MRKILIILLIISLTSISVIAQSSFELQDQQAIQWVSFVRENCNPCSEGQLTKFDINITNSGQTEFAVRSIVLVDADNIVFASGSVDILAPLNSTKQFSIEGVIPPATKGKTLYYKACFVLSSLDQSTESCENSVRRLFLQNNVEAALTVIYLLLSVILLVIVVFFLIILRRFKRTR